MLEDEFSEFRKEFGELYNKIQSENLLIASQISVIEEQNETIEIIINKMDSIDRIVPNHLGNATLIPITEPSTQYVSDFSNPYPVSSKNYTANESPICLKVPRKPALKKYITCKIEQNSNSLSEDRSKRSISPKISKHVKISNELPSKKIIFEVDNLNPETNTTCTNLTCENDSCQSLGYLNNELLITPTCESITIVNCKCVENNIFTVPRTESLKLYGIIPPCLDCIKRDERNSANEDISEGTSVDKDKSTSQVYASQTIKDNFGLFINNTILPKIDTSNIAMFDFLISDKPSNNSLNRLKRKGLTKSAPHSESENVPTDYSRGKMSGMKLNLIGTSDVSSLKCVNCLLYKAKTEIEDTESPHSRIQSSPYSIHNDKSPLYTGGDLKVTFPKDTSITMEEKSIDDLLRVENNSILIKVSPNFISPEDSGDEKSEQSFKSLCNGTTIELPTTFPNDTISNMSHENLRMSRSANISEDSKSTLPTHSKSNTSTSKKEESTDQENKLLNQSSPSSNESSVSLSSAKIESINSCGPFNLQVSNQQTNEFHKYSDLHPNYKGLKEKSEEILCEVNGRSISDMILQHADNNHEIEIENASVINLLPFNLRENSLQELKFLNERKKIENLIVQLTNAIHKFDNIQDIHILLTNCNCRNKIPPKQNNYSNSSTQFNSNSNVSLQIISQNRRTNVKSDNKTIGVDQLSDQCDKIKSFDAIKHNDFSYNYKDIFSTSNDNKTRNYLETSSPSKSPSQEYKNKLEAIAESPLEADTMSIMVPELSQIIMESKNNAIEATDLCRCDESEISNNFYECYEDQATAIASNCICMKQSSLKSTFSGFEINSFNDSENDSPNSSTKTTTVLHNLKNSEEGISLLLPLNYCKCDENISHLPINDNYTITAKEDSTIINELVTSDNSQDKKKIRSIKHLQEIISSTELISKMITEPVPFFHVPSTPPQSCNESFFKIINQLNIDVEVQTPSEWKAKLNKKKRLQKNMEKSLYTRHVHLCNRNCGGSHTMTSPAQRVARAGLFLRHWGLQVTPYTCFAPGIDGRMYRVIEEDLKDRKHKSKLPR